MEDLGQNNIFRIPIISILITLLIFFLGFQIVGPFIGALIALPFYPGTQMEFWDTFKDPFTDPDFKISLLIMQASGAIIGMIIIPYFFLRRQGRRLTGLFHVPYFQPSVIVPVLVIVFMGVNAMVIRWNEDITLPFGLEEWARPMEEKMAEVTVFLTRYESTAQAILAFIVVAILPAIGEEIIFRGMIQNDLYRATRNEHVSIWVAAFLFSAIHLQFYGFFPRMFLGALFGYLYFWSANLWMPVLAHFINNAFTLVSLYLFEKGAVPIDMEKAEPTIQQVLFSAVFSAFLLYAYKNFHNKQPKADIPD